MREFLKMALVLFLACGLAAASLAVVNGVTKKPIKDHEEQQKQKALKDVAGEADEFVPVLPDKVWDVMRGGRKDGRVFIVKTQGYSGPISMAFAVNGEGVITGLDVLTQTETPGLGVRVDEPAFKDQFKGKRAEQVALKKDDPARGQIDAVTGATISSRAVANAVRATLDSDDPAEEKVDGATGATAPARPGSVAGYAHHSPQEEKSGGGQ